MRPLKLTLQGFTSFAERTEIDFSEFDLFAITGPTGAGKTSILDAMMWALYGRTPRLGKCGSELISHGKSSVAVHFEFAVGAESYRVTRTAKCKGSGQVRFEGLVNGDWVVDDASGVAETNEAIARAVGLDFDAFKLSVVLPQGEFDCFLRGDHAERRKILKSLLGLEIYDRMRDAASIRRADLSAKVEATEQLLEREYANATEERLKEIESDLRQQKRAGKEATARVQAAQNSYLLAEAIVRGRAELASNESDRLKAEADYLKLSGEAKQRTDEACVLRLKSEEVQRVHDGIVIDERRFEELLKLSARADELDRLNGQRDDAQKRHGKAQRDLLAAKSELASSRERSQAAESAYGAAQEARLNCERALEELRSSGSKDLLEKLLGDLATVPAKLIDLGELDAKITGLGQKQLDLRKRIDAVRKERTAPESKLKEARAREQDLSRHAVHRDLRASLKPGEPCPVCEQVVSVLPTIPAVGELDAARLRVREYEENLQQLRDEVTRAETELDGIPQRVEQLETQRKGILADVAGIRERVHPVAGNLPDEDCARMFASRIDSIGEAERDLKRAIAAEADAQKHARDAARKTAELEKAVEKLATALKGIDDELGRLAEQVARVQPEIDKAGGRVRIASELEAVKATRTQKAELADRLRKLQSDIEVADGERTKAETSAARLSERVSLLSAAIKKLRSSLDALEAQWTEAITAYDMPPGANETERASKWRESVQKLHSDIQQRISDLQAQVKTVREKIEYRAKLEGEVAEGRADRDVYEQICYALRADRFIDYLLGRAYEDLCRRGSDHLMGLSGERYSFTAGKNTFSVKDGWNGDAERPASTLSGGESFFASLALALALAESVATFRADGAQAARLEALFLDEGVSTLDQDEALPAVVDALINLQAGDRMIGVISHMENLAQRLPARIEVLKNHGRSAIRVDGYSPDMQVLAGLT